MLKKAPSSSICEALQLVASPTNSSNSCPNNEYEPRQSSPCKDPRNRDPDPAGGGGEEDKQWWRFRTVVAQSRVQQWLATDQIPHTQEDLNQLEALVVRLITKWQFLQQYLLIFPWMDLDWVVAFACQLHGPEEYCWSPVITTNFVWRLLSAGFIPLSTILDPPSSSKQPSRRRNLAVLRQRLPAARKTPAPAPSKLAGQAPQTSKLDERRNNGGSRTTGDAASQTPSDPAALCAGTWTEWTEVERWPPRQFERPARRHRRRSARCYSLTTPSSPGSESRRPRATQDKLTEMWGPPCVQPVATASGAANNAPFEQPPPSCRDPLRGRSLTPVVSPAAVPPAPRPDSVVGLGVATPDSDAEPSDGGARAGYRGIPFRSSINENEPHESETAPCAPRACKEPEAASLCPRPSTASSNRDCAESWSSSEHLSRLSSDLSGRSDSSLSLDGDKCKRSRWAKLQHKLAATRASSVHVPETVVLIPKLNGWRSLLIFSERFDLNQTAPHFSHSIIKRLKRFQFSVDNDLMGVIRGCVEQHGENWLSWPLISALRIISESGSPAVELVDEDGVATSAVAHPPGCSCTVHSIETYFEGTLVAGELGVVNGSCYTSLTGFAKMSSAGSVQLCALSKLLLQRKFEVWDLGMDMEYKRAMGAILIPRSDFVQNIFTKCKTEVPRKLGMAGRQNCAATAFTPILSIAPQQQ